MTSIDESFERRLQLQAALSVTATSLYVRCGVWQLDQEGTLLIPMHLICPFLPLRPGPVLTSISTFGLSSCPCKSNLHAARLDHQLCYSNPFQVPAGGHRLCELLADSGERQA